MFHVGITDYWAGAQNLIEASGILAGDTVLLLADRRSDPLTMETLGVALNAHKAVPMSMVVEPSTRYGTLPKPVLEAMKASDVVIWVWPVFLTFNAAYRAHIKREREDRLPGGTERQRPYFVYFEGTPGLLATDYARFPNALLWTIAEVVKERVANARTVRLEGGHGTELVAEYQGRQLYGMQFGPGDPPGRCHFPWGRCGVYNGNGTANGTVWLDCLQGVAGRLASPVGWRVENGWVVETLGNPEVRDHLDHVFEQHPQSRNLTEIMFGYHPKANVERGLNDPMHWELISKMPWVGLGTPRNVEPYRHVDGAVLNTRLYIDDTLLVDEFGRCQVLDDDRIQAKASEYGDPSSVLASVAHEGHGLGAVW